MWNEKIMDFFSRPCRPALLSLIANVLEETRL